MNDTYYRGSDGCLYYDYACSLVVRKEQDNGNPMGNAITQNEVEIDIEIRDGFDLDIEKYRF